MNLIEALKSGRRFKRPSWHSFVPYASHVAHWSEKDLLADDYELEPEPRKRVQAFIVRQKIRREYSYAEPGEVLFFEEGADLLTIGEGLMRAPWLDEPAPVADTEPLASDKLSKAYAEAADDEAHAKSLVEKYK